MNLDLFIETLPIMGKGMLGIFVVTLTIIFSICLLNHFTRKEEKINIEQEEKAV